MEKMMLACLAAGEHYCARMRKLINKGCRPIGVKLTLLVKRAIFKCSGSRFHFD
jgi:hypothetical protein